MELGQGIELNYADGKLKLEVAVAAMAMPVLNDLEAKVNSGAIDPIKGTDLDKSALLGAISFLKAQVGGVVAPVVEAPVEA